MSDPQAPPPSEEQMAALMRVVRSWEDDPIERIDLKHYTIRPMDKFEDIARAHHVKPLALYQANADELEKWAQVHGFRTSSYGHWIFPGMVLTIPRLEHWWHWFTIR